MLTAKDWGQDGGDQVTAEFRSPAARQPAAERRRQRQAASRSSSATDAHRRARADGRAGRRRDQRQARRPPRCVTATTYRGNAGAGIVPAARAGQPVDFLNAPAHVARGPFQQHLYRIGTHRDGTKAGVFLFCQQHAREWATGLTCVRDRARAGRELRDGPDDQGAPGQRRGLHPRRTSNPDGAHYSMYDSTSQRKTMTNYCPATGNSDPAARNTWGVDLNRNSGEYSLLRRLLRRVDQLHQRHVRRPVARTPSRRSRTRAGSRTRSRTSSSRTTSTPTAATSCGRRAPTRTTARARRRRRRTSASRSTSSRPARRSSRRIKELARHGDPAGAHGPDRRRALLGRRQLGRRHVVPQGHHRLLVRDRRRPHPSTPTTGTTPHAASASSRASRASAPAAARAPARPRGALVNEGRDEAMEFAAGNFGLVESAYDYGKDVTPPTTSLDSDGVTQSTEPDQLPVQLDDEAVGHPLHDRRLDADAGVADVQGQRARSVGEVLTLSHAGRQHGQVARGRHQGQRLRGPDPALAGRRRRRGRHRRRHRAGDAVADARHAGGVRRRSRRAWPRSTRPRRRPP